MHQTYRIVIADDDPDDRAFLRESLIRAGHEVVVEATSGEELVNRCATNVLVALELVITDVKMKDMDGLHAAMKIAENREVPFMIVSGYDDDQLIERACACRAFAYLVKPIRESELKAAICMAAQRFQELQSFRTEAESMRQALEDRKIVERAKGILMRERALDEPSAFRCLQQLARQHRQKLVDVAKSIQLAEQALRICSTSYTDSNLR